MSDNVLIITDTLFDAEVLKSEKPVLVDFWAPWCGPCKAVGPIIDELAAGFGDEIKFAKCNVDENPLTPGKYGIRSIPTIIFFKNGSIAEQIIGAVPKTKLEDTIKKVIGESS